MLSRRDDRVSLCLVGNGMEGRKPYDDSMLKKASTLASWWMFSKSRLKSPAMMMAENDLVIESRMCVNCSVNNVGHVFGGLYICPTISLEQGRLHWINSDSVSVGLSKVSRVHDVTQLLRIYTAAPPPHRSVRLLKNAVYPSKFLHLSISGFSHVSETQIISHCIPVRNKKAVNASNFSLFSRDLTFRCNTDSSPLPRLQGGVFVVVIV